MTRILSLITLAFIAMTSMAQSTMNITINATTKVCTLVSNTATAALLEKLEQGDVTYTASDYGGFEKVGDISFSLPTSNTQITTQPGDVILYSGNNIVIFYGQNSWSYTRLGRLEGLSIDDLKTFLAAGSGNVQITLSLPSPSAIDGVKADGQSKPTGIFLLNGQRLDKAPEKGIYIENGIKKVK